MKILCDVCNKDGASFFCVADEAALCSACDHRVHHVNKLAGQHLRFSLTVTDPSPEKIPLCDVCQVKWAFLFCQQDRAILCKDCDYSIHKVNELTQNHNRFLLTGTKLSVDSKTFSQVMTGQSAVNPKTISEKGTSSSISEFLIERLPGWRVDDFLDSYAQPHTHDLSKEMEEDLVMPMWDYNHQNSEIWVPQAPSYRWYTVMSPPNMTLDGDSKSKSTARKWTKEDGSFTVPQMNPRSSYEGSKRSRFAW